MIKRLLALMLSFVMILTAVPVQAFAQEGLDQTVVESTLPDETEGYEQTLPAQEESAVPETESDPNAADSVQPSSASGSCGTDVTWILDDNGVLTISGTGNMTNYNNSNYAPWFSERLNVRQVVISDGITHIGSYAFYYCINLQSVSIADSVKTIGSSAFEQCTALQTVELPIGVTALYESAFEGCTSLRQITLPETLTSISYQVFCGCTSLASIEIPSSVQRIESSAFDGCTALRSVTLPEGLEYISSGLFAGCTGLESVVIPESVTEINSYAFSGCIALTEIAVPAGVTYIGSGAFENCKALTDLTLPDGIGYVASNLFYGCTGLQKIDIPKAVARIEQGAFRGCTALREVTFPDALAKIDNAAFLGCTALQNIVLPAALASLGSSCFEGCTGLTAIALPDSLMTIDSFAFYRCSALESIVIPSGLESLGAGCFKNCSKLSDVTLPDGLQTIGNGTFSGCTALESIELPSALTALGAECFYECTALSEIVLPETLKTIEGYTFYGCTGLRELILPEGLQTIQYNAFSSCKGMQKASIPSSVSSIGSNAFGTCTSLTDITFGHTADAELTIASNAFSLSLSQRLPTTVSVPYARNVHSAISGYDWANQRRTVTYRSHASLPVVSISIDAYPAQAEVGLEVFFTATVDPWYTTSDLLWEVVPLTGKATIDANGVLIGTEPGFVTVRCKSSDDATVCDAVEIEILKATAQVSSIYVRCEGDMEAEVELGDKVQMIADIRPGNAVNKKVIWEVENGTGTASITSDGVLLGLTCGTVTVYAIAQDGSEVIGSRVIEILRYVDDITIFMNGQADVNRLGVEETAYVSARIDPEDASYTKVKWTVENVTGEARLYDGYLTGVSAGTVILSATSTDSRQVTVSKEIEIVGEKAAHAVAGGYLYYNTVTGTIIGCDDTVTSADIPASISGVKITTIAPQAFYDKENLTSVTIPGSVSVIGRDAFRYCYNLTSLRINGTGLRTIGEYAFYYCERLLNLTIPECVTEIGYGAFYNLASLKNLTVPGDLDTSSWLSYGNSLDCVTFTGSSVLPGTRSDYGNGDYGIIVLPGRNARKVILTDSVKEIGDYAFDGCDKLEEISFGNGVTAIGNHAFYDCDKLLTATISENVKSIGNYAFYSCERLTSVILPEGIQALGEGAFSRCRNLESINLPASLKTIGKYCFSTDSETYKLQLIDLSSNPEKMTGREMQLNYAIPQVLIDGTNKKNEIRWEIVYTWEDQQAGKPNPHDIAYVDYESGMLYSHGTGVGNVTVECYDEYTGASGTWTIEISSGIVIRKDREEDHLVSGDVMQLSAWIMPGDVKTNVEWSIREQDQAYASISSSGKLTARAVTGAHQIEVSAHPYDGGEVATMKLWIIPRTTGLYIYDGDGDVTGMEIEVDSFLYPSLQFTAVAYPDGALTDVIWKTSNDKVASVDNGLVTFNGLGNVTISVLASDGSGKSASVNLNVTFQNSAKNLTATVDAPDNTLRAGETAQMLVYGADPDVPMDPSLLEFGIPDSQKHIASVDQNGMITAGEKAGTATVTASLKDDPLCRRVSVKITVKARKTEKLILHAQAQQPAQVQMLDANGNITNNAAEAVSYAVLLKKADVAAQEFTFVLTPEAFHSAGSFRPEVTGLKWASSNGKIAAVAVQKDGTAVVTVKQGVDGACVISAVTNDEARVENRVILNVRDYAPRLETQKPVLNTSQTNAAVLSLVSSYENWITAVALLENGSLSERLQAEYDDEVLTIVTKEPIPNSNLKLLLRVNCADGEVYEYPLTAKVKNVLPAVTVKQQEKFNLFYTDSEAAVKITVKNAQVERVELEESTDFTVAEYDTDTNLAILRFSDSYILEHSNKADTKAKLLVYLEGYEQPVKKSITISTTNKKPSVQLTAKSGIVNTAISQEHVSSFGFCMKDSTQLLSLRNADVEVSAGFAQYWVQGDRVVLTLNAEKGGTATVNLRLDNWMQPIKLKYKVTVETKAPALRFSSSTLVLNSVFTDITDSTAAYLSQSNLTLGAIGFESTAREGTSAREEADKLEVSFDPDSGEITARIKDSEVAPKPGSYVFAARAALPDGTALSEAKIKVSVTASVPKVKLAQSTLKLNKVLYGYEIASTQATGKLDGYRLMGFAWDESDLPVELDCVDGQLTAQLSDPEAEQKTYSMKLYPILLHEATGQQKTLPAAVSLRVKVFSSQNISVALSQKGKLDAVNPDSEICYTVKKITNASGSITGVSLDGPDAELFDVSLNENGTVSLKLLPGESYLIKRTYKVQFVFCICGMDVTSSMQSFKVSQSTLKIRTEPAVATLYQAQTTPVSFSLTLTEPVAAEMAEIKLNDKSNQTFLDAMGTGEMDVTISEDGRSAVVVLDVRNPAALQIGGSYALYLDVIASGSAEDGKLNQVKLTINVKK